jgi:outer membrane protein OmpA-like peptidoglycan-associated protein
MIATIRTKMALAVLMGLIFAVPAMAQDQGTQGPKFESGKKQKVAGIIVKREGETIIIRDRNRTEISVSLTGTTKIEESKKNPFRSARQYDMAALVRGIWVEVQGRGNDSGVLVAEKLKFTDEDYREAASLDARVEPAETRITDAEGRLAQSEQNQQRLSGQLEELAAVANTARGGAKAAQDTADKAIAEIAAANQRINETNTRLTSVDDRVTTLDDYEAKNTINITFRVNSATLSDESKTALDEIASQAKSEKGYVIQIAGFASADGDQAYNRRLSERRANAVISYLIENHDIPQRRIIIPYGFGELKPVGDNKTREGREQNRRVEVAILVSKGLGKSSD